jgi:hypothetical protein
VPGAQRRFLAVLAALAVVCAGALSLMAMPELVLYFTPALLVVGLLLCGRYVGEERILARRASAPRPVWRAPRNVMRPGPSRPLGSVRTRRARLERGPPPALFPAA